MDREQLVRDLVRLRRAHLRHPDDEDLAAVRADLERAVGPTVGRAVSARLLGVSQTALDRWIARGEVPAVLTPAGRREVPLAALVELLDAVEASGPRRHPLAAVLRRRGVTEQAPRRRPADAPAGAGAPAGAHAPAGADAPAGGHRAADLRGLAYHRAVARRLDDALVADALARLRRWRAEERIHPRYADAWERLLTGPRARLRRAIVADDEAGAALRQSSPLAGALGEAERRRVLASA